MDMIRIRVPKKAVYEEERRPFCIVIKAVIIRGVVLYNLSKIKD